MTKRNLIKSSVALTIAGTILLPGCGGGGTAASTSGGATSTAAAKEEFAARANEICARNKQAEYRAMISDLERTRRSTAPRGRRIDEAIRVAYLPRIERQIGEIRALAPPPGEGWQVKAFAVALKEGIYTEKHLPTAKFGNSFTHADGLAHALGIGACVL